MQIVVLGMHRSGTSAVSRLINLMGAHVGDPSIIGKPASDNEKGFWERADIRKLNDAILSTCGCDWSDVVTFNWDSVERSVREGLQAQARDIVFEMEARRPWVIKDPRLSVTLDAWKLAFEAPVYVIPYRHPMAVALSLQARNGIPTSMGIAIWEEYLRRALSGVGSSPRILVAYEDLIEQPEKCVMELFDSLCSAGVSGLHRPSPIEISAFIDARLQHHRVPLSEGGLPESVAELHRWISRSPQEAFPGSMEADADGMRMLEWLHRTRSDSAAFKGDVGLAESGGDSSKSDWRQVAMDIESAPVINTLRSSLDVQRKELESVRDAQKVELASVRDAQKVELASIRDAQFLTEKNVASIAGKLEAFDGRIAQQVARIDSQLNSLQEEAAATRARTVAGYEKELAQQAEAQASVIRSISEVRVLLDAVRQSARWRIGNAICRTIEAIMLRGAPRLALDRIQEIVVSTANRPIVGARRIASSENAPVADGVVSALEGAAKRPPAAGKQDVIVFPVIDWHFRVQRPQHLARELGAAGHRVFYLSTKMDTSRRNVGFRVTESPAHNVFLVELSIAQPIAPNIYRDEADHATTKDAIAALGQLVRKCAIDSPIAIIDLPFWAGIASTISGAVTVYDCMDHHAGFSTNDEGMLCRERQLIQDADVVVVTSDWLSRECSQYRPVEVVRNGAEVSRFEQAEPLSQNDVERPRIGYIGAISEWFDLELVDAVAVRMPDVDFVLVGDVTSLDTEKVGQRANISFVGEVPYDMAPSYVRSFDVCLIPFKLCDLTLATNPVKAYEYLAAGKPVVATPLPELLNMDGMISVADSAIGFESAIRAELDGSDDAKAAERRREWARKHDWSGRASQFADAYARRFPTVSVVVLSWNNLEFTQACLASIDRFTRYPGLELILVDNGSTDDTPQFLQNYAKGKSHVRVLLNEKNLGFSAGNNVGLQAATGEYLVLLNNDTYVTPGWLQGLIGHLLRNPDVGIIGPVTNNIGNEARIDINYGNMEEMVDQAAHWTRRHPRELLDVDVVGFFCCAFSRETMDRVGLLDEQFGRGFFEDDDYCRRVSEIGLRVVIAEDVFVHHHLSASFDSIDQDARSVLFEENKKKYEEKWGTWAPHVYRSSEK